MGPAYRITFTRDGAEQLQEIFDYIEKDSARNASRMIARIVDAIDELEQLPHRYPVLHGIDTGGVELRSMPVKPYLVRYYVDDQRLGVTIVSVRHGARRPGL